MDLSKSELWQWQEGSRREWLLTNGLGGYASGTATGINTRRYHGLLMAALAPPAERTLAVAKTEDALDGIALSANLYHPDVIHPDGYRHLESFSVRKRPVFLYRAGEQWLEKSIFMVREANLTIVQYKLLASGHRARLTVRPLVAYRNFHHLLRQNDWPFAQTRLGSGVGIEAFPGAAPIYLLSDLAGYQEDGVWYKEFLYLEERERGLDAREDLYSPGYFHVDLEAGQSVAFAFAVPRPQAESIAALKENFSPGAAEELWQNQLSRRERLLEKAKTVIPCDGKGEVATWTRDLVLAADNFIVRRGEGQRTVIAGYPWFGDWGRDTMIALEGLTMLTGRFDEAWEILSAFAAYCKDGLLPNVFPDVGTEPAYNSVDAPLWFVHAAYRYWQYTLKDHALELYPTIRSIIEHYRQGTAFGIGMAEDYLIAMDDAQLTWMDAKVGDLAVTPRADKPIEIQALWYNALCICAQFAQLAGDQAWEYEALAAKVRSSAGSYWSAQRGYLADQLSEPRLRPNQLLAFSLPFPLFDPETETGRKIAQSVLAFALSELYIGPGLRTLGSGEPDYHGRYGGNQSARDRAYHQGAAWSWLLGPCLDLAARLAPNLGQARRELWLLLTPARDHFYHQGALGQISEIFAGDWPHHSCGCFAQAWGVAELLRIVGTYLAAERSIADARNDA